MPTYTICSYSEEHMINNLNVGKNVLLELLRDEGLITPEKCEELSLRLFVTIDKPSRMSRLWKYFIGKGNNMEQDELMIMRNLTTRYHKPENETLAAPTVKDEKPVDKPE